MARRSRQRIADVSEPGADDYIVDIPEDIRPVRGPKRSPENVTKRERQTDRRLRREKRDDAKRGTAKTAKKGWRDSKQLRKARAA